MGTEQDTGLPPRLSKENFSEAYWRERFRQIARTSSNADAKAVAEDIYLSVCRVVDMEDMDHLCALKVVEDCRQGAHASLVDLEHSCEDSQMRFEVILSLHALLEHLEADLLKELRNHSLT